MTKKRSLFSEAAASASETPDEPAVAANPFGDRLLALHETAERVPSRLRRVDPERCRMWVHHNRSYELLTEENCRDLIDSIVAQGAQEQPAIVREIRGEGGHDYEVIAGARRHFAITWLRAHNYPQMKYYIEVRDMGDEECFRLADLENRNRKDISDYERAKDYQNALKRYYATQLEMAKRLNVAENWLSRYLLLASLPTEIVSAYADIHDLKLRHARDLSPMLKAAASRKKIIALAVELARQNQADVAAGATPMSGPETFRQLLNAAKSKPQKRAEKAPVAEYTSQAGKAMLAVNSRTKNKLTLVIDRQSGADEAEVVAAFSDVLKTYL